MLNKYKATMNKSILIIIIFLNTLAIFAQPTTITYQGVLTDDEGRTITGTRSIRFDVFTVESGGSSLWNETHTNVEITKGLFEVELGSVTPFGTMDFSQELWLEIIVESTILTPRIAFNASGYALASPNYGMDNFTGSYYSYDSKAGVKLTPNNAAANVDFVIQPKGTGAILAQQPCENIACGNKRGNRAVDLQMSRDNVTQVASGEVAAILGGSNNTASGYASTAMGGNTMASGQFSTAMGFYSIANKTMSTAMGGQTTASGTLSTAMGFFTAASGNSSTAMGYRTTAPSAYETVIGRFNTDYAPSSTNEWISSDRLFVVGNGTGDASRSNALTILKNGNTTINGGVQVGYTEYNTNGDLSSLTTYSIIKYSYNGAVSSIPTATNYAGKILYIINASGSNRTINSSSVDNGKVIQLISDGTNWYTVSVTP